MSASENHGDPAPPPTTPAPTTTTTTATTTTAKLPPRSPSRDPASLADALGAALKACAVWPRANPRVKESSERLVKLLQGWVQHPDWLPVRLRGLELWVGERRVEDPSPVVDWLVARCRDTGLAGLEFAAGGNAAAVVDFGVALAAAGQQRGNCTVVWPQQHPSLRPLDLLFEGTHELDPAAGAGEGGGLSAEEAWKGQLMAVLAESAEVQSRLRSFEEICGGHTPARAAVALNVLKSIVELLPMEVACDAETAVQTVVRILAETHVDTMAQLRSGAPPDDVALMRTAMNVARTWFASSDHTLAADRTGVLQPRADGEFTADVDALLADLADLPASGAAPAPATDPAQLARELCGILLHVLQAPQRPEAAKGLLQELPRVLAQLGPAQLVVLDAYLQPRLEQPPAVGDVPAITILQFLERTGRGNSILARRYVDGAMVARTFPGAFPPLARLLGGSVAGIDLLRAGLHRLAHPTLVTGAEQLAARGALREPAMIETVRAIGGEVVLPILRCALAVESPEAREAVITYLRTMPLPAPEAAALRCLRPPAVLPASYLEDLCRLAEDRRPADEQVRTQSGQLLRAFVAGESVALPADVRLRAVRCLGLLPGAETVALLRRLVRQCWLPWFRPAARKLRAQAVDVLAELARRRPE